MRLSGRFLFVHTQKHTQECSLDSKSSWIQRICFLLAVHGTAEFWTLLLEASHTPSLVDFKYPPPYRTPTPANRRLRCADLCTVFCSNDAVRALKSHPKVAVLLSTHDQCCRLTAQQELTPTAVGSRHPITYGDEPLRTTRSQLECIIRDILYNNFIKFNVHIRLQGYGLPAQQ